MVLHCTYLNILCWSILSGSYRLVALKVHSIQCQSMGLFIVNVEQVTYFCFCFLVTEYLVVDHMQELSEAYPKEIPGIVPAGRLSRYKEVILLNDLIDCARPGKKL
ncbi:hypothetical protein L6452_23211 [Arctium lappa]|uniref:Uncharacterized protein n=1 Tax=Arctium lappa TaxID=4217 RepID=A0ACB9B0T7_ARCLA|nr:hypothetical protein L6452_23211 [Arctium lappa]